MGAGVLDSEFNVIYLVRVEGTASYKVGITSDLGKRVDRIQTDAAGRVRLLMTWPGDRNVEQWAHKELAQYRIRGEWFDLTDDAAIQFADKISEKTLDPEFAELRKRWVRDVFSSTEIQAKQMLGRAAMKRSDDKSDDNQPIVIPPSHLWVTPGFYVLQRVYQ